MIQRKLNSVVKLSEEIQRRCAVQKGGVFPPPVKIGAHAVGWVEREVDEVLKARIAGQSDDEIRALVSRLIKARSQIIASDSPRMLRIKEVCVRSGLSRGLIYAQIGMPLSRK